MGEAARRTARPAGHSTPDGYQEHSFTWEVVLRIRSLLNQLGVRSALSRGNDNAPGPCVDERAAMANALQPNAIVSIHADGGPPSGRGFHVNYSAPPLNQAQAGPAVQLARIMRDQLQASGIPPSNYVGQDGFYGRGRSRGAQPGSVPGDPRRTRQHEEPRRRRADHHGRGPAEVRSRGGQRHRAASWARARRPRL